MEVLQNFKARQSTSPPGTSPFGFWYPVDCRDSVLLPPRYPVDWRDSVLWPPRHPVDWQDSVLSATRYSEDWRDSVLSAPQVTLGLEDMEGHAYHIQDIYIYYCVYIYPGGLQPHVLVRAKRGKRGLVKYVHVLFVIFFSQKSSGMSSILLYTIYMYIHYIYRVRFFFTLFLIAPPDYMFKKK